jgi:hypothetical protein
MWNLLKQDLKIHFKAPRYHLVGVYETICLLFWESNKPHTCMKSIEQILLQKLTVTQPVKFSTFYGTKICIDMFTQAPQLVNILSHMNPDYTFTSISPRSNSNYLSIYTQISHVISFWHSSLPTKNLCGLQLSPTQAAHPIHFTLSDIITLITSQEEYKLRHSSIKSIAHSPVCHVIKSMTFFLVNNVHNKFTIVLKMIHTHYIV